MSARPRLSPAMRNMLHNAVRGRGLRTGPSGAVRDQTVIALRQRGLVDAMGQPTQAGREVFAPLPAPGAHP